jgi:hypothetical protein
MTNWRVVHIAEPSLEFGFGQKAEHPKDGLFLFGPPQSNQNPARMDIGVIGTSEGIRRYERWVATVGGRIAEPEKGKAENKMLWPGFQAVFGIPWPTKPFAQILINASELSKRIRNENRHEAIFGAVDLYQAALRDYLLQHDARPQQWFAVVPEEIFKYGRPKSHVPKDLRERSKAILSKKGARSVLESGSMFVEELDAARMYEFELNFHNQLKSRILDTGQVIQVVRETTLTRDEFSDGSRRSLQDAASVAWNLSTTSFYKSGGKPWRIADVRDGVCYVGLIFKRIENAKGRDNACCGAQMFLQSGEGVVFKGAVGPWFSEADKSFHLSKGKASELMDLVVKAYTEMHGKPPNELFIHGQVRFNDDEWEGFLATVPATTKLVGVQIRRQNEVKLFRFGKKPVLRGTAIVASDRMAYLWTKGFTPRLETYPGREVPNPITVNVVRGDANIEIVLADLMALTKLNYNSTAFADGTPVTLRFANLVGEILTAGPTDVKAPLPFKFYI